VASNAAHTVHALECTAVAIPQICNCVASHRSRHHALECTAVAIPQICNCVASHISLEQVASPRPMWPTFTLYCVGPPVLCKHTKFQAVLETRGVPKFKRGSRDPASDPLWPTFAQLSLGCSALYVHTKFQVFSFNRSWDMQWVHAVWQTDRLTDRHREHQ